MNNTDTDTDTDTHRHRDRDTQPNTRALTSTPILPRTHLHWHRRRKLQWGRVAHSTGRCHIDRGGMRIALGEHVGELMPTGLTGVGLALLVCMLTTAAARLDLASAGSFAFLGHTTFPAHRTAHAVLQQSVLLEHTHIDQV
jgi:hypothetical protein